MAAALNRRRTRAMAPRVASGWAMGPEFAYFCLLLGAALVLYRAGTPHAGHAALAGAGMKLGFMWLVGHCDSMDGPVVALAARALETGDVELVLPWVRPGDEAEVREAFRHARAVRRLGPEARALADRHFFETLVRIHRAGEGAPYTGLKPAGRNLGPAIPAADRALETGSVDSVVQLVCDEVARGIRRHFEVASRKRRFRPGDVPAGREYVEAYVAYVHYVEGLYAAASEPAHGHGHDVEKPLTHHHAEG